MSRTLNYAARSHGRTCGVCDAPDIPLRPVFLSYVDSPLTGGFLGPDHVCKNCLAWGYQQEKAFIERLMRRV